MMHDPFSMYKTESVTLNLALILWLTTMFADNEQAPGEPMLY